jgi:hypothetical protein
MIRMMVFWERTRMSKERTEQHDAEEALVADGSWNEKT